ncbi:PorT family protein [Dysgonomonas sp. 521]|uniref:porin family protein n=1 Tax=Dysgonomonas sp. 521 TaxID=2302932 RepID=UPI0013CF695B|nr:porin family protein [Dysgonomonas sp. 521]NDV96094.1 PorT family protein [Dysgonomonas sp. 521]
MKNILKLLFATFLLFQSLCLSAQDEPYFRLGVKAGGNLYTSTLKGATKKVMPGYQIGLTAEYALSETGYLQTEVTFTTKGTVMKGSQSIDGGTGKWSERFNMQYINVPLMMTYKLEIDTDFKAYFRGGLYGAYGIGGKTTLKTEYKGVDTENTKTEKDTFGKDGLKKFDAGVRFGTGLEFEKFSVGFDFEYGILDLSRRNSDLSTLLDDRAYRNKGASLSVGYRF